MRRHHRACPGGALIGNYRALAPPIPATTGPVPIGTESR
jgi:hypothetical protein